jgi:hypothetical protein
MPAINENRLRHYLRVSGMNQVLVLPVIEHALLKAVLAWYL